MRFPLLIGLLVGGAARSEAVEVPEEEKKGKEKSSEATLCINGEPHFQVYAAIRNKFLFKNSSQ